MSNQTLSMTPALYEYLLDNSLREHPLLERLRQETAAMPQSSMQIAPEQGQLLALLIRLGGARRCLEVGVFTGYSSLNCALALPPDGYLLACDRNAQWTATAQRYWREAGVDHLIELRLAPALQTLDQALESGGESSFDFAFIDADKGNYIAYYERCLRLVRPGGLIAVDNVLWGGSVADAADRRDDTQAIRAFNRHLHGDQRIDLSLVPIGDGLTLCRRCP